MDAVRGRITAIFGTWGRETTLAEMRAGFADLISAGRTADFELIDANGVPAAWFGRGEGVLFYCHGGGYQMGSIASHGPLMADLAGAAGIRAFGFDYRLAPEHKFPAALDDSLTAYCWLLDQGINPSAIAIGGDSAGCGLALATLIAARDRGLPLPAAAVFLSPWVDLEAQSDTFLTNARVDPLTQKDKVLAMARAYIGRQGDPKNPLASPINGDMSGLPPMLIHVGRNETVLGDTEMLARTARNAGVSAKVKIWDEMIHHFQVFPELNEARASIAEIGAFLGEKIA